MLFAMSSWIRVVISGAVDLRTEARRFRGSGNFSCGWEEIDGIDECETVCGGGGPWLGCFRCGSRFRAVEVEVGTKAGASACSLVSCPLNGLALLVVLVGKASGLVVLLFTRPPLWCPLLRFLGVLSEV